MTNNIENLTKTLPIFIHDYLQFHTSNSQLIEIILDLGRRPEGRFITGTEVLSKKFISWQDLEYTTKKLSRFSNENRAGIERTLHRISCFRNRQFLINGLTCRVGRSIFGTVSVIRDLLESCQSILILGKPGVGKTTIIREIARVLADDLEKRVIIIDTSNEIAGDSDIPHFGIGRARRMQVTKTQYQHQVMVEAVENHMPEVIVIDEIGTDLEVLAARTIAEKGVQLIGTTHGNNLKNLIKNPILVNLIGEIEYVTLSDEEAKRRNTRKSILERKSYPTFETLIEINSQHSWTVHEDIKSAIDFLLQEKAFIKQIRLFATIGKIQIRTEHFFQMRKLNLKSNIFFKSYNWKLRNQLKQTKLINLNSKILVIYPYSLSGNLLKEILLQMGLTFQFTNELKTASCIIGLKQHIRKNITLIKLGNKFDIPIYSISSINYYQLRRLFLKIS